LIFEGDAVILHAVEQHFALDDFPELRRAAADEIQGNERARLAGSAPERAQQNCGAGDRALVDREFDGDREQPAHRREMSIEISLVDIPDENIAGILRREPAVVGLFDEAHATIEGAVVARVSRSGSRRSTPSIASFAEVLPSSTDSTARTSGSSIPSFAA